MQALERLLTAGDEALLPDLERSTRACLKLISTDLVWPGSYMVLHNVGVACRQLTMRGKEEFSRAAEQLLGGAVDRAFESLVDVGSIEDLLLCVSTYLRAIRSGQIGAERLNRIQTILEFSSRSDSPAVTDRLAACWPYLGLAWLRNSFEVGTVRRHAHLDEANHACERARSLPTEMQAG